MPGKKSGGARKWVDPDDAPELTKEWFAEADLYEGERLIRRGRPRLENPKEAVNIRLSPEVLAHFRAGGPGWQTRIDEALRHTVARERRRVRR